MADTSPKAVLTFNGNKHDFATLTTLAGSGPRVELKIEEIDLETAAQIEPPIDDDAQRAAVFFKFNGKFVVLAGRSKVAEKVAAGDKVIKGNLISTPALKRARIVPPPDLSQQLSQLEDTYANRPRFTGNWPQVERNASPPTVTRKPPSRRPEGGWNSSNNKLFNR